MLDFLQIERGADPPFHELEVKVDRLISQSKGRNVRVDEGNRDPSFAPCRVHVFCQVDHPS